MLIISSTFFFVFVNLFWSQHTDLEVLRSCLVCCVVSDQSAGPAVTTAGSNCIGQFSIVYIRFSLDWLLVGDLLSSWNTDICLTFFQQWAVRTPIIILKNLSSELNSILIKVALSMCRLIVKTYIFLLPNHRLNKIKPTDLVNIYWIQNKNMWIFENFRFIHLK